jgi:hypothetical protein
VPCQTGLAGVGSDEKSAQQQELIFPLSENSGEFPSLKRFQEVNFPTGKAKRAAGSAGTSVLKP